MDGKDKFVLLLENYEYTPLKGSNMLTVRLSRLVVSNSISKSLACCVMDCVETRWTRLTALAS